MKTLQQRETEAILALGAENTKLKEEIMLLTNIIRDQSMEIERLKEFEWMYNDLNDRA